MAISNLFLLLALFHFSKQHRIEGRKRLQKLVCIMKHGNNIPFSFNFKPYYYGPYSEELTEALDTLTGLGYLKEEKEWISDGISQYSYELTPSAKEQLESELKKISPEELDLEKIKKSTEELEDKLTEELVLESKTVSKLY